MSFSGFSEFETYGTYVMNRHSKDYNLREWKSLREGIFYFPIPLDRDASKWVAKKYNAISFENHDSLTKLHKLWNNKFHYKHISINFTTTIMWPYMMFRKYVIKR